jgi:chemotaxis protein CheC
MSLKNIDELNSLQMDVLTELGNIGSGNAATSLSNLVGKEIIINVPKVKILGFNEAVDFVGGPENLVVGVLIKLLGDIEGLILYIFEKNFVSTILNTFFGKKFDINIKLDDMDESTLKEIGNIMASSYVNAIGSMTDLFIDISVPSICVDMAGAILSVPAIEFAKLGNKVLFIDDSFSIGEDIIKSKMILVPEMDSLYLLFKKLGVDV